MSFDSSTDGSNLTNSDRSNGSNRSKKDAMETSPGSSAHERDRKSGYHREHRERSRSHSGSPSRFYAKDKRGGSRQGTRGRDRESRDSLTPPFKQQRSRGWGSPTVSSRKGGSSNSRNHGRSESRHRKKSKERKRRESKRSRSRSRSRHRSPRRSGSSKKSKRRNSSGSSSSDLCSMDTSLIGEIKKKHGDIHSSKSKKRSSRKKRRKRNSSSSESSSGSDAPLVHNNGMALTAVPPPTSFFPHATLPSQLPPPPMPPPAPPTTQFITPPPPPPPPFGMPPTLGPSVYSSTTASVSFIALPPAPPTTTSYYDAASSSRIPLPLPPENKRMQSRAVIITKRGITTNRPVDSDSWYKTNLQHYEMLDQIGEGTYGQVYKAVNKSTGEKVALKRVRLEKEKEGFPITAIREIKILRQLHHKNIVRLIDIVIDDISMEELKKTRANFYLVFEYVDHDLIGLLESKELVEFNKDQICSLFKQLLEGLAYIHHTGFLHRDIKCSNILVNNKGELKIADLGLARLWQKESRLYTNLVITLWYRPPELLLGDERYGPAIDVWSAGCMLGEMFTRKPLFNGNNEMGQLELISKTCGSPNPDFWPELTELPVWNSFKQRRPYQRRIREEFEHIMPRDAVDLLDKMLTLNPERRITAKDALLHPWIRNLDVTSVQPIKLPQNQDCHEMWSKKQKRSARLKADGSGGSGHSSRAISHPRVFEAAPASNAAGSSSKTNGNSSNNHHPQNNHHHASSVPPLAVHPPHPPPGPPPPPLQPPQLPMMENNHHVQQQQPPPYQPVFFK